MTMTSDVSMQRCASGRPAFGLTTRLCSQPARWPSIPPLQIFRKNGLGPPEIGHSFNTETVHRFKSCKIHETTNNHDQAGENTKSHRAYLSEHQAEPPRWDIGRTVASHRGVSCDATRYQQISRTRGAEPVGSGRSRLYRTAARRIRPAVLPQGDTRPVRTPRNP